MLLKLSINLSQLWQKRWKSTSFDENVGICKTNKQQHLVPFWGPGITALFPSVSLILSFFFLAAPRGMWDLCSPTTTRESNPYPLLRKRSES